MQLIFLCRFQRCCISVVRTGRVMITSKSQSLRSLKGREFFLPRTKCVRVQQHSLRVAPFGAETQRAGLHPSDSGAGAPGSQSLQQRREHRRPSGALYCLSPQVPHSRIAYTHSGLPGARSKGLASAAFLVPREERRTRNGEP